MFNSTVDYIYTALARHDRTVDYIHTALARHDRADLVQQYIYLNVMINYYFFFCSLITEEDLSKLLVWVCFYIISVRLSNSTEQQLENSL